MDRSRPPVRSTGPTGPGNRGTAGVPVVRSSGLVVPLVLLVGIVLAAGCSAVPPVDAPGDGQVDDPTAARSGESLAVSVTRVVDGDTVEIRYANGTADTVRLIGVDTPEVHSENTPAEFEGVPETEAGRNCLRRWGERASSFATERLADRSVTLRLDPNLPKRGFYNRLLAYVEVAGKTFNYRLVANGYARVYDSEFSARQRYLDAEATAREEHRGLWACTTAPVATPTDTATPTRTPGASGLVVAEIHADAAGNDNDNLDDEYVVLANRGEHELNLSGWTVEDEVGKTYTVPDGFVLDAGGRVTLHTGSGSDSSTDLYWGRNGAVWNNGGDVVTVRYPNGTVAVERSY